MRRTPSATALPRRVNTTMEEGSLLTINRRLKVGTRSYVLVADVVAVRVVEATTLTAAQTRPRQPVGGLYALPALGCFDKDHCGVNRRGPVNVSGIGGHRVRPGWVGCPQETASLPPTGPHEHEKGTRTDWIGVDPDRTRDGSDDRDEISRRDRISDEMQSPDEIKFRTRHDMLYAHVHAYSLLSFPFAPSE